MGNKKSTPVRDPVSEAELERNRLRSIAEYNSRIKYGEEVKEKERKLQQQKEEYEKLLKEQQSIHLENLRKLKKNEEQKILILEQQLKLKDEKLQGEARAMQNREQMNERMRWMQEEYSKSFVRPGGYPMRRDLQDGGHFKQPGIYAGSSRTQEKQVQKEEQQNVNLRKELKSQQESEWVMVPEQDCPLRKYENNLRMQNPYSELANNLRGLSLEKKKLSTSVNELRNLDLANTSGMGAASNEHVSDSEVADTQEINRKANRYRNKRRYGKKQNVQKLQPAQTNDNLQPTSDILGKMLTLRETKDWKSNNLLMCYVELPEESAEFKRISYRFHNTSRNQPFTIRKIVRIENPILLGQFLLRKEEMRTLHGNVFVRELFHGTKDQLVNRICDNNLDWRCYKGTGVIYGNGVYFTPIAKFAADNCDKYSVNKVLLVCDVLTASACPGHPNMIIPPIYDTRNQLRHDTTYKDTTHRSGIVKFSDFEFYPKYLICFVVG